MSDVATKKVSARRNALLADAPGDFAVARFVRVTPMKMRRVADLIRGVRVEEAVLSLRFAPQSAAADVLKTLESAIANAVNNQGLVRESLVVTKVFVDEGPTMKRFRPRAQGRAGRILKRSSHLTVVVEPRDDKKGSAR